MRETTQARSVIMVSLMVFAVFVFNGIVTFYNLRRINAHASDVLHSHDVQSELERVQTLMADAETGARGYVISEDKTFLEPYLKSVPEVRASLKRLEELIADNGQQKALASNLRLQIDAKLQHLMGVVSLTEDKKIAQAESQVRSGFGKNIMNKIRATLAEMKAEETNLLKQRDREFQTAYYTALVSGGITSVLGLVFTMAAAHIVRREMGRYQQAARELKNSNDFLEQRVSERTSELSQANNHMRVEIDERRRMEEQVRLFADELQRSNRELEQFASVASHDLQEPLRKIQAFCDRLAARYREGLEQQGRDYVDRIQTSARRMRTLIDDLLEYSRVSTKVQAFEEVELSGIVGEVLSDLETRLQQTHATVELGELPVVRASPLQMRQLFQNLIANALKFHQPDLPPVVRINSVPIAANGNPAETRVRITVEDNGIGFEPQYGERIFDLFQRLHGREEYEGTGIGLAICRKIVERHNGEISAESTPGKGARFLITLPAARLDTGTPA